ncbi:hypothetical protein Tco_1393009 [Tanacetum coccineum]
MSNMSEDIWYAGSDTRPPMLDRTDFESWQQRIHAEETEGALQMVQKVDRGLYRPLSAEEKGKQHEEVIQHQLSESPQSSKSTIIVDNCQMDTGSTSTDT